MHTQQTHFPSASDDAFIKMKKTNKGVSGMSIYNQLLIFGRVHPGHVILSSSNKIKPGREEELTPQRVEFTINPENTNICLKRSFPMLEDIERQNLFSWRRIHTNRSTSAMVR